MVMTHLCILGCFSGNDGRRGKDAQSLVQMQQDKVTQHGDDLHVHLGLLLWQ